ncbi:MAG: DUF2971 domain-containing protein [Bacteroidales bacterium]|nr:DUF2971 domain-containing protein [Bacteroidales bacterium]MCF8457084.1 DUF2971 domain-containing protein [Bacteroidales bacterium]
MINKYHIEESKNKKLNDVISTNRFYQFSDYNTALKEIILKCSLRFANPATFNDPFDCNELVFKIKHKDKLVDEILKSWNHPLNRGQKRELIRKLDNPLNIATILKKERERFKMSCFSKVYNEMLLWSFYADKHKGICVGFDFPPIYDNKFILASVEYLDKLEPIDGEAKVYETLLFWFTVKLKKWEYEKEVRAIHKCLTTQDYEYVNYDKKFIKEVIFGCNVSTVQIKDAMHQIENSNIDFDKIEFKKMIIDSNTSELAEIIIKLSV